MTGSYRKDLSHITWAEVYKRQEMRAGLVEEWLEALALQPGDRVLDMGSGPGFVSLVLADRVGVGGV
ncbi:MAG: methyltransferase type 12, partial [Nitrospinaceae bacterium]|nr:methyltransferase type 12 [Nitrospinaceae bacterium]